MNPDFIKLAQQVKRHIVLPESNDDRILEAASEVDKNNIATITLLGSVEVIITRLNELKLSLGNIQIVDPNDVENPHSKIYAEALYERRKHKGISQDEAAELSKSPLYYGDLMVHAGDADACVAGVINSTGNVIRAALHVLGTKSKATRLSSFFIMLSDKVDVPSPIIFADCAINIDPDAEILADIAIQSSQNAVSLLGLEPKVAMLSFSTNASAKHAEVDKVRNAVEIINKKQPDLTVIGDVQFDAAFSNEVLNIKWKGNSFQAPANIFVFPSLEAGNIGYKIAERIGGADAIGPILQGLAKPVNDLSRGADVEDIIKTIAVTSLQVVD
ncbi:MAG: phosphate acetyltransferase [Cocleimonas sp.]